MEWIRDFFEKNGKGCNAVNGVKEQISSQMELSNQAIVNIPPRVRMTTLYAVSQCMNGRVVNTCNFSED